MDGRIILKWNVKELFERLWNGLILVTNTGRWRTVVNAVKKASVAWSLL
jgi:hypothetical protein